MFVQSLRVSGFMSFKDVTWKPGCLNVLIGPNGSGKSNLLRALDLIRASAAGDLRDSVIGNGGFPRLLWAGSAEHVRFEIITAAEPSSADQNTYRLALAPMPQSASFRVEAESLKLTDQSGSAFIREGDSLTVGGPVERLPETETYLSLSAPWMDPSIYAFLQQLSAWAIYQDLRVDERSEIRRPAVVREEMRISPDGQNLTPVLNTLYKAGDAIDQGMSAAFPDDYDGLFFRDTEPGRVQLCIRRKHGHRVDSAADLSDGTLRFLLLLAILVTPDPPPLIAIDEPESGLHPSMLPIIAEFAAMAATRTQVILSTHSPQMLDAFGGTLPATTVFTWAGDHTELKTVGPDELKSWVEDYSLGRFIFSGEAAAVL
jgi:predicted ATPase